MRGIPSVLKTPLLIVALLAVRTFLSSPVESTRLVLLRIAAAPFGIFGAPNTGKLSEVPEGMAERLAAVADRALSPYRASGGAPLAVLDLDTEEGWLLVAGGSSHGVRLGAPVLTLDGCVGVVDRVTSHLARARLLTARGVTLPVQVRAPERVLPGDIPTLVGILEGTGERTILGRAHLPDAFRQGDFLETLPGPGEEARPVATVTRPGVRPDVALIARPDAAPWVRVAGVEAGPDPEELFEARHFAVSIIGGERGQGALIVGAGAGDLEAGSAVHHGGWYLGRIVRGAMGAALVRLPDDAGTRIRVQVVGGNDSDARAVLAGSGGARLRVASWVAGRAPEVGPVLVATSGGQELVPPGLLVGHGRWTGERLELERPDAWPARVEVSVFRFAAERRRLVGRRR